MHIKPVGVRQMDYGAQCVAALVLIVEPALVAATLGLTPTESEITVRLAEGPTVRKIAAATGRQASSIWWYLKQIYHKQQLSGQADVVRLVLSVAEFV